MSSFEQQVEAGARALGDAALEGAGFDGFTAGSKNLFREQARTVLEAARAAAPDIRTELSEWQRRVGWHDGVAHECGPASHRSGTQGHARLGTTPSVPDTGDTDPAPDGAVARVTRAQVVAAQGRIAIDRLLGRATPEWIRLVAVARRTPPAISRATHRYDPDRSGQACEAPIVYTSALVPAPGPITCTDCLAKEDR